MKKRRWSDGWLMAALTLLSLGCAAQDSFHYRIQVDTPARSGFYRMLLTPAIVALSKTDLSDLRILGADGHFVPYVIDKTFTDEIALKYVSIPEPVILQVDSGSRRTILTLSWSKTYRIDLLSLMIRSPTLYKRDARISSKAIDGTWTPVTPVSIDPHDTVFRLPGVRTRSLRIEIDNADNPPLKAIGASADQIAIYLLAYLQTGSSYALLTGNPKAGTPRYDLGYFTDTLKGQPNDIGILPEQEVLVVTGGPDSPVAKTTDKSGGQSGFMLWSILSTVLLLLIYFSVKMVGAIGTKKTPNDRV